MRTILRFKKKGGSGHFSVTLDGDRVPVEASAAVVRTMVKEWGGEWGEVP